MRQTSPNPKTQFERDVSIYPIKPETFENFNICQTKTRRIFNPTHHYKRMIPFPFVLRESIYLESLRNLPKKSNALFLSS